MDLLLPSIAVGALAVIVACVAAVMHKYTWISETSTVARKETVLVRYMPSYSASMNGSLSGFWYWPVETYTLEMENGDCVNVALHEYNQHNAGDRYTYRKRVKRSKLPAAPKQP